MDQEEIQRQMLEEEIRKNEERSREAVRETLRGMGIETNAGGPQGVSMADSHPLGVLEEVNEETGTRVALPEEEQTEEDPPVRRQGSGPFSHQAKDREQSADPWVRNVTGLGEVRATDFHQQQFEEIFFTEEPYRTTVRVKVGRNHHAEIVCRTLSVYERELAALVVKEAAETNPLTRVATRGVVSEFVLRAHMLMQIESVDGKEWPALKALPGHPENPDADPLKDELAKLIRSRFADMPNRTFAMLAKAVHIFEVVNDILEDAMVNGDFTDPAGSGFGL